MSRELSFNASNVDANRFLSKVVENAGVSQKIYRTALDMLDEVKKILSRTVRIQKHLQQLLYMAPVWLEGKIMLVRQD
jgi:hypothetical protein